MQQESRTVAREKGKKKQFERRVCKESHKAPHFWQGNKDDALTN
jgi:hypothetical protein